MYIQVRHGVITRFMLYIYFAGRFFVTVIQIKEIPVRNPITARTQAAKMSNPAPVFTFPDESNLVSRRPAASIAAMYSSDRAEYWK